MSMPNMKDDPMSSETEREALDRIMEQAQVFASAWSLVGGQFDNGGMLENAEQAKAELRGIVEAVIASHPAEPPRTVTGDRAGELLSDPPDPVLLWAEIHRLRDEAKGPDGFATWKEAATDERIRRVQAEAAAAQALKGRDAVLGAATKEDFCGVDQEVRTTQTRRGTEYGVAKWSCPNCAKACSTLYIDDEWCHGDSLLISYLDGVREVKCGSCWLTEGKTGAAALTDGRILDLWDTHVGPPARKYPLTDADKLQFARAVLAASQP